MLYSYKSLFQFYHVIYVLFKLSEKDKLKNKINKNMKNNINMTIYLYSIDNGQQLDSVNCIMSYNEFLVRGGEVVL